MNDLDVNVTTDVAMALDRVVGTGDLSKMTSQERVNYYVAVCKSVGLNPMTNPFAYIMLNGKVTLYAKKDCTDQLRKINGVNISVDSVVESESHIEVWCSATTPDGRRDVDCGIVSIKSKVGDEYANAKMKALTKAKRRVTLSISGLGWLDESEIESIKDAKIVEFDDRPTSTKTAIVTNVQSDGFITSSQIRHLADLVGQYTNDKEVGRKMLIQSCAEFGVEFDGNIRSLTSAIASKLIEHMKNVGLRDVEKDFDEDQQHKESDQNNPDEPLPSLLQAVAITLSKLGFDASKRDQKLLFVEHVLGKEKGSLSSTKDLTTDECRHVVNSLADSDDAKQMLEDWQGVASANKKSVLPLDENVENWSNVENLPTEDFPIPTRSKFPPTESQWNLLKKLAREKGITAIGVFEKAQSMSKFVKSYDDIGGKETSQIIEWIKLLK